MKFEIEFQINFVAFFMRHQLGVVPHLEELLLLHVVKGVQQLTVGIIRDDGDAFCNVKITLKVRVIC